MNLVSASWVLFMGLVVLGYWLTPRSWRDFAAAAGGAALLFFCSPLSALALAVLVGAMAVAAPTARELGGRMLVLLLVLGLLTFVASRINSAIDASEAGIAAIGPLGLAYYMLRYAHYAIERYKGTLEPHTLRQFVGYMFFAPTLFVGPVNRFPAYLREARRVRWDGKKFAAGLERVLYGYVKIVVLGNFLMGEFLADALAALLPADSVLSAYGYVMRRGFHGYLLIAGYSDVAIGFALLLGHRVMENFDRPLLARNISEFWRAWHISVSSWFRAYVYTGTIALSRSPVLAVLVSMILLGLWHAASLSYLAWGVYNGLGIVIWQGFVAAKKRAWARAAIARVPVVLRVMAANLTTVHFFVFGLVLAGESSLGKAFAVYQRLFGFAP